MASNIISSTIDDTYPVAGVDNDTQGFRDNFNVIKTGLTTASSEITNLQNNTPKTNATSSFNNNSITTVNLLGSTKEANSTNVLGESTLTLSFVSSHFFRLLNINGTVTVTLDDWPETNKYAEILIHFSGNGSGTQAVTFASDGASTIYTDGNSEWTNRAINVPASADQSHLVRAYTYDNGLNVFLAYLGKFVTTT